MRVDCVCIAVQNSRQIRPVLQTILQQRAFHLPAVQAGRTYKPAGRQFDASLQRLWPAAVYPVFPQILCSRKHQVPFLRLQSSSPFALQTFGIRYAAWECRYGPPVLLSKLDIDKILVSILCPPMSLWEYGRYKIGVQIIQISRCLRQRRYSLLRTTTISNSPVLGYHQFQQRFHPKMR